MTRPPTPVEPTAATARPELVAPGVWQLRIPLRVRVDPVNAWILRSDDGAVTIVDCGVAPGADELWAAALGDIGAAPGDVRAVVVTHHHPDHIGGAGALHRLTGAPLIASASTVEQAPDVWGDRGRLDSYYADVGRHLDEHGLPGDVGRELADEPLMARAAVELPPDDAWQVVDHGAVLADLPGGDHVVHLTPGHADGHLVLHAPGTRRLVAGDHLLERISPAVGRFPRHDSDPLGSYLQSLEDVAQLDVELVLPGHGAPFLGAADRARALAHHHAVRIDECVAAVATVVQGATAHDVARVVFARVFAPSTRDGSPPDAANQRFATTESLAHLEYARLRGRLVSHRGDDGRVRFRTAGA